MFKTIFRQNAMEGTIGMIESLFEKAVDYGKTSFLLVKLRTLKKTSDVVSSLLVNTVVLIFALSFMLFLSLGIAIWVSQILGNTFYGFFVVAAFYGLTGVLIHLFLHNRIKKLVSDRFIKQVLK
jgi:fatty acid desaturase